jgi:hypothetical protein
MRRVLWLALVVALFASPSSAAPFTVFDVIAPATVDIVYNQDSCLGCGFGAQFTAVLIAATTEQPVDISRMRLRTTIDGPFPDIGFFAIRIGGGMLPPGEVTRPLEPPGLFAAELLPWERFSLSGTPPYGITGLILIPPNFVGDVVARVTVRGSREFNEDAVATFSILLHIRQTSEQLFPFPSISTVTSTQRLSPTPIPEPWTLSLLLTGAAGLFVRSGRRRAGRASVWCLGQWERATRSDAPPPRQRAVRWQ